MIRKYLLITLSFILISFFADAKEYFCNPNGDDNLKFFAADNAFIQYTGRIDFTNPKLPRFWQPGVYITVKFKGQQCEVILNDEILWGKNHNYLEIIVDGEKKRIQTKYKTNYITISKLPHAFHTLTICKNTESNIGGNGWFFTQ